MQHIKTTNPEPRRLEPWEHSKVAYHAAQRVSWSRTLRTTVAVRHKVRGIVAVGTMRQVAGHCAQLDGKLADYTITRLLPLADTRKGGE